MSVEKLPQLREELAQIQETARGIMRKPGGISSRAYYAAFREVSRLSTEIAELEATSKPSTRDKFREMPVEELKALYAKEHRDYTEGSGGPDTRRQVYLMVLRDVITEQAAAAAAQAEGAPAE